MSLALLLFDESDEESVLVASVLIDCESLRRPGTGVGQFCLHLAKELAAIRESWFKPVFLVDSDDRRIFSSGTALEEINWKRRYFPRMSPQYDLWHATHEACWYWPSDLATPILLTIHDLHFLRELGPQEGEATLRKIQKRVDRAQAIAVVSKNTRNDVNHYLKLQGKPIYTIYNGLNQFSAEEISRGVKRPTFMPEGEFLFALGTIHPRKNFHVLIDFLAQIPGYKLVIAGNKEHPYCEEIRKRAIEENVADRLVMPGEVFGADKYWLFSQCAAYVFPSKLEGFGLSVIEAMSFGKPVFLSDYTSLPEVGGSEAYYWKDLNGLAMKTVFFKGLADFESQRTIKEIKVKKWAERFSWQVAAQKYLEVYKQILTPLLEKRSDHIF